jgi:hypothetical protein
LAVSATNLWRAVSMVSRGLRGLGEAGMSRDSASVGLRLG